MKNVTAYLASLFCIVITLQGCVKIDAEIIPCAQKPNAPTLSNSNGNISGSGSFSNTITNYNGTTFYYYWFDPDGKKLDTYNSSELYLYAASNALPGQYKVVCNTGTNNCASDTTTFNLQINYVAPSCGSANNSFEYNSSVAAIAFSPTTGGMLQQYYTATWANGNYSLKIEFGYQPQSSATRYSARRVYSGYALESNQAQITFNQNGTTYYATDGQIYVTKIIEGVMQIEFCDMEFDDTNYNTIYYSAHGKLQYNY